MKRNQNEARKARQSMQLWSHARAQAVLPYLASIVRSLREHKLESIRQQIDAQRLANRPGRPDRDTLISHQDTLRAAQAAEERFEEALAELQALDIYCADPVGGQVLIPFLHDKQLAWFLFDLFETKPLQHWRYHTDDPDTRRPITQVVAQASSAVV